MANERKRMTPGAYSSAASPPALPAPFPGGGTPDWAAGLNEGSTLPSHSPYQWTLVADTVLGYGTVGTHSVLHARVFEAESLTAGGDDTAAASNEAPPPVVILGQFGDHTGPPITQYASAEPAAAAAQARFYPDGRQMRVVLLYPNPALTITSPVAPIMLKELTFHSRRRRSMLERWWRRRQAHRTQQRGRWDLAVTSADHDGVTRHVLPDPGTDLADWVYSGVNFGRELTLEVAESERSAIVGDFRGMRWSRPASVRVPALLGDTELLTWPEELYTAELIGGPEAGAYAAQRHTAVRERLNAETGIADAIADPAPGSFTELGAVHSKPHPDRNNES